MEISKTYDVIIIGGSYAGLSAAMALGRAVRTLLVLDNGKPCNAQTPHSHNFLTQDGKTPKEIASVAKQQVSNYETISFVDDTAVAATQTSKGFQISTARGDVFETKKSSSPVALKTNFQTLKVLLNVGAFRSSTALTATATKCVTKRLEFSPTAILPTSLPN